MVCFGSSTLFHRKSKSNLRSSNSKQDNMEECALRAHARQFSIASSNDSRASSEHSSKAPSFHPLSSHPPLRLNAGPVEDIRFMEDEYHNKENRETKPIDREYQPVDSFIDDDDDDDDYSLLGDNDYYTTRSHDSRRMTYRYDKSAQWPLKDWQTIPPGLAAATAAAASQGNGDVVYTTPLRPRPANHQRRPTDWMNEPDVFVKRGAWKRRGIVFGLDSDGEQEQIQHFELPN